tara:strand:+ start:180 stop:1250 length:1071 start_codon:yes stop_codon:yes gene_type:complete
MSINVNTVYTTVLTILNKEQRGYLTPFEFNNVANQVQLEIFEKFFEDYNQYTRMPQTDVEFASRMDHTMEEFQVFETSANASNTPTTNIYTQPGDLHRFGSASWNKGINSPPIEILTNKVYNQIKLSDLTQPSDNLPVAKYNKNQLTVFPSPTAYASSDVTFNYIRKPYLVRWGYFVGGLGQFLYDPTVYGEGLLNNDASILPSISPNLSVTAPSLVQTVVEPGVTTGVTITKANASATGLKLNLAITLGSGITTLSINTPGTGYSVGDTITFAGSTFDPNGGGTGIPGASAVCELAAGNFNGGSTYGSTDFEISDSQQTEVILEILKYSGIIIRDPQIVQAASQELAQEEVNSKR